jgi:phage shock protein C
MTRRFTLDRTDRKLMGVCAGLGRSLDVDNTVVRIGAVLSLFVLGPIAVLLYFVAGWVAPDA